MKPPMAEKLEELITERRFGRAVALLERLQPPEAAHLMMAMPFPPQQTLFVTLPAPLAAALAGQLPYYHAYVLLQSRPARELRAIVDHMKPGERIQFLDELPEEAWRPLMDELSREEPGEAPRQEAGVTAVEKDSAAKAAAETEAIIEAIGIEQSYLQPDGRQIQVIASTDLAIEPGSVIALLGPSGSGRSTLLRMLTGLAPPTSGRILWHGAPLEREHSQRGHRFSEFRAVPLANVSRERRDRAAGARPRAC